MLTIDDTHHLPAQDSAASQVTFQFLDGVERQIQVSPGQTILDAAKSNDIRLVHQCKTGSCGTCVAKVLCGDVRMSTERGTSLFPSEHAEGLRLTCSSFADTDCVLGLDYASTLLDEPAPALVQSVVTGKEWVAPNVVKLTLALPCDVDFEFRSGQYVRIRVPGTDAWRSYSMASSTHDLPAVTLLLRVLDEGMMSNYLRKSCAVGDELELEGPYGTFYWRPSKAAHILIAGGTGLAPMLAMLDDISVLSGKKPKVLLSFGCATADNLFCLDELDVRAALLPNLALRVSVSSPDGTYGGLVGNPVSVIAAEDIVDPETVAYLCGPPAMIESARRHLEDIGVKRDNIHAEQFSASAE
ncbi:hypothetical protein GCM10022212_12080 [Actimicrobium antarcticum]|uniref:Benzoate/toluate 1,2-dioxygenase reductase subunit n=2 Tax=Actimicrobium antarcticum TaxID=1051899 RepID=A0ABP7SXL6_9BURK